MREDFLDDLRFDDAAVDFTLVQLCKVLGIDPETFSWDAATETFTGDVQAVIGNILRAKYGEDWGPDDSFEKLRSQLVKARASTIEECASHLEAKADLLTNSLHCGDDSATIAMAHKKSRQLYEAAAIINELALTDDLREGK